VKAISNILAWILALLLAVVFLFAGGVKLLGARAMVQEFAQIGIGQWFRYFTGILEVSGAIGVLIPKYRFGAALQIAVVMVGATTANIWVLHLPPLAYLTAFLLAAALALAWLRRPKACAEKVTSTTAGYR
jgi:putative oxidoreductase